VFWHVCKITNSDNELRHFCLSVCPPAWNNSAPTGQIFMKFVYENFAKICRDKAKTRIMSTLREDQYTFMIISRSVLFRMRNVSGKSCRANQNTHIMFNNLFFENGANYEIIWKNNVESNRPQTTEWRSHIACQT